MNRETALETSFQYDDNMYDKKIQPVAAPQQEVGIDLNNQLIQALADLSVDKVDISKIQSFTSVSRNRNELYDTLDYMAQDTTLASVLETYAEDATEMNDSGDIVWCESDDENVGKYVNFLLKSLNVNRNIFKWTHTLCKYGDLYLRLFRESDVSDQFFDVAKEAKSHRLKNPLHEDVNVVAFNKSDRYVHYVEQAPNPAQLFELTRFGKTAGYVKTNVKPQNTNSDDLNGVNMFLGSHYRFNTDSNDVTLYPATEWVHACLEDSSNRSPEEVELFTVNDNNETSSITYNVRRGESLLYDSYKTWRELMLLENSVLLNRVTQSSIVRVIGVEVGDMPKESVQPHLMNIKQLIEQKAAFSVGNNMNEYNNPGPIVNNIYIPIRNNQGMLTTQQIGGDVKIGELVDLAYYEDKLFGGLRVPKQYFGRVDDAAGFSGGQSLSIISSRYAKMIKRIQSVMIQLLTDVINLILIDTDNKSYINKFNLKMLAPTTQEEVDRRDNVSTKMGLVSDIMNTLSDVEDTVTKLKILKSLLSDTINNTDVVDLIQEHIDNLEAELEETNEEPTPEEDYASEEDLSSLYDSDDLSISDNTPVEDNDYIYDNEESTVTTNDTSDSLPSPEELGIGDVSDSTNPELG